MPIGGRSSTVPDVPNVPDARSEPVAAPSRGFSNPLDPRNPLAGVYLAAGLFELAEAALRFLVPINLDARGLAPSQIGFVIFAFSLTSLLSRGVAGALFRPDRARLLIVGAGLASTVAYLITPFVSDVAAFTVLMAIDGFGWGIATTCLLAMVMLCTPPTISPGVAMGWYIGFQGIAFALATTVAGVLGQLAGVTIAMLVLATLPVMAAVLLSIRMPRIPSTTAADAADQSRADGPADAAGRSPRALVGRLGLLPVAVWAAAIVAVYLNLMNGLLQTFFPLLGLAVGLSIAQIGTLQSIRTGVSAVARFGAGTLFARVPAGRLHVPLVTMSAATLALLPSAAGYLLLVPLFALNGISRGLLRVTTSAAAMEATPGHQVGLAAAVMTSGLDVGKMIGPLVGGLVASAIGIEGMFRVVPLAFLVIFGALYLGARRRGRIPSPVGPASHRPDPTIAEEA